MNDTIELALLGDFAFSTGGSALQGMSADSQRLLAFLALRHRGALDGDRATRWAEFSEGNEGASLRSAVSRLEDRVRHAVEVTPVDVRLAKSVVVDVHHARSLARSLIDGDGPPSDTDIGARVVSALSKDLLPGWYDDWAVIAAEDWRHFRLRALEAVAAQQTAAARLTEAAAAALAAVRGEPLREAARAALIRMRMAEGNHGDALREFERYRELLHGELGIEPTSRLRELVCGLEPRDGGAGHR